MSQTPFTIDHLGPADLAEAGAVLDAAFGRTCMVSGLRLAYSLQPESWFCARDDAQVVATVGAYDYGPVASIGMMAVAPRAQRQGVGETLLGALLEYLGARGCPLSFLDASAAGQRLYPKLGFVPEGDTLRMRLVRPDRALPGLPAAAPESHDSHRDAGVEVRRMEQADVPAIAAFDAPIFGADRREVLGSFWRGAADRAFVAHGNDGSLAGYVIAAGNHIGPWVSTTPEAATALLSSVLALPYSEPPFLTFPEENAAALALLTQHGFAVTERLLHMRRGGAQDPRQTSLLYSQASLTLG